MSTLSITTSPLSTQIVEETEITPQQCINERNKIIERIALNSVNEENSVNSESDVKNFLQSVKSHVTTNIPITLIKAALGLINQFITNPTFRKVVALILEALENKLTTLENQTEERQDSTSIERCNAIGEIPSAPTKVKENREVFPDSDIFVCPGHSEFFHHYSIKDKAVKKAEKAIRNLLKNSQIDIAKYALFDRDTPFGSESGYFNRLNRLYKYAVVLNYTHIDNSPDCLHN
ncbi:MAG: hypothetical protein S4CHLAM7_13360 [Chlamydiae bacterium]|nr:hypothetical protein [Chlamydiota bacterium]